MIVISQYLIDMATDAAREMRAKGLTEAPIDQTFFVTSDWNLAHAYLSSIIVDDTKYFVCHRIVS